MRELAYGGKFNDIISNEFLSLETDIAKSIYASVALCYSQRHSVSIDVLYRALHDQIGYSDMVNLIGVGNLRKVVLENNGRLKTRHIFIAQHLLRASKVDRVLSRKLKADLMIRLMKALAPLVNVKQLTRGTPEALLVKNFMDYDHIENVFGEDNLSIERFFTELKPHYDWNSKYWAQRGLFESKRKNYGDAKDFVDYAVTMDDHWTIRNAKGVVYLRAACSHWNPDFLGALKLYKTGIDLLESVLIENSYKERKSFMTILAMCKAFLIEWNGNNLNDTVKDFERF